MHLFFSSDWFKASTRARVANSCRTHLEPERLDSAPKAASSPKAAKAPPCCATPAEKPEAAAAPQLTEEEQQRGAAMQEAVKAKERGNKRFQGRQYQLVRVPCHSQGASLPHCILRSW